MQVLRPISSGLHYLEGDDADASHLLPVYCTLHQNAQSPHADVADEFSGETLKAVAGMFEDRWLGKKGTLAEEKTENGSFCSFVPRAITRKPPPLARFRRAVVT